MSDIEALKYPIGKFTAQPQYNSDAILACITEIEHLPEQLEQLVKAFPSGLLDRPYRPGSWTARQVIHHVADSHTNAYVRTKWMLTENLPTIKAYDEKAWALTPETTLDPAISLDVLKSLHRKWVSLLRDLPLSDFTRRFVHPETGKEVILDRMIDMYSWHGKHHCGHLRLVLEMK